MNLGVGAFFRLPQFVNSRNFMKFSGNIIVFIE